MDAIDIKPLKSVDLTVRLPGSKSYTNRALAVAALAKGESRLTNVLECDDTIFMIKALEKIGVWINHNTEKQIAIVNGSDGHFLQYPGEIYVQNAGTAMRFLTTMLTLGNGAYLLSGNERMQERPISDLTDALIRMGAKVKAKNGKFPPVLVDANGYPGGTIRMPGNTSSQYISSLLISAPYARKPLRIEIEDELVSKPYIDMTIELMQTFGAYVENDAYRTFTVSNEAHYSAADYAIESDASNASYFFAMPAITGGRVRVENISYERSKQGDVKFVDILEKMGCEVERGDNYIEVRKAPGKTLNAIDVDMTNMPDIAQTLAVVALQADGPTRIGGVHTLRIKETDRIQAIANEMKVLGINIDTSDSEFTVYPAENPRGGRIETYDDHRMAMAFSLAGLFIDGITIAHPSCVNKTFPKYFKTFQRIYE